MQFDVGWVIFIAPKEWYEWQKLEEYWCNKYICTTVQAPWCSLIIVSFATDIVNELWSPAAVCQCHGFGWRSILWRWRTRERIAVESWIEWQGCYSIGIRSLFLSLLLFKQNKLKLSFKVPFCHLFSVHCWLHSVWLFSFLWCSNFPESSCCTLFRYTRHHGI